jgi:urease gamma subunit
MAKMTKAQKKRMVKDIMKKTQKLFQRTDMNLGIVSVQDMVAIEKMCNKWMNRIG